jgi:hypothetical protein
VIAQPEDTTKAKDPKKKEAPAKPGKKSTDGPAERLKGEFDKDCIKLEDNRVRVPGNTALWAVNFAQNILLTRAAADDVIKMLQTREPTPEELVADGGAVKEPAPYAAGIQLQHFEVSNTQQEPSVQESLNKALQAHIALRK